MWNCLISGKGLEASFEIVAALRSYSRRLAEQCAIESWPSDAIVIDALMIDAHATREACEPSESSEPIGFKET